MFLRPLEISIISDIHLGSKDVHATELLNYLKSIKPKILIINGDFIELRKIGKIQFPQTHLQIIQEILFKSINGTKVYYINGNAEEALRYKSNLDIGSIHFRDKLILNLKNKKYWIFHGDIFDPRKRALSLFSKLGYSGYKALIRLSRKINKLNRLMGFTRSSFSSVIKNKSNYAQRLIRNFEDAVFEIAKKEKFDYVICGHIHWPTIKSIQKEGLSINYMNSGDWIDNLTALEYAHDNWSLYEYDILDFNQVNRRIRMPVQKSNFVDEILGQLSNEDDIITI